MIKYYMTTVFYIGLLFIAHLYYLGAITTSAFIFYIIIKELEERGKLK